ncbi:MAG: hypothetical protein CL773_06065 [Chloroflexi bacterium]|nr:hypothetical protein [Chloroflexota bacterium]|tara:strand:- start:604 stop:1344 length:741 start_codon:yes stop_codon:yes gene_type:complete
MKKSVTIDLWETIMGEKDYSSFSVSRREKKCKYIYDYLEKIDKNTNIETVISAHDFVVREIAKFSRFHSDLLFIDWIKIFINKINPKLINKMQEKEIVYFGDILDQAFLEDPPGIFQGTYELIEFCKLRNIKLGIISNTGFNSPKAYRKFMSMNKISYDVISLSNELGTAKPHSEIFLKTLNNLDTIPKNSIHFGDNPVADILGATNIGMDAVLISKNKKKIPVNSSHLIVIDSIKDSLDILLDWI